MLFLVDYLSNVGKLMKQKQFRNVLGVWFGLIYHLKQTKLAYKNRFSLSLPFSKCLCFDGKLC